MLNIIKKFRDLLDRRERRNAVLLFIMILGTGVLEAVGVASVMPFLSVLSNPEVIQEKTSLEWVYETLGFTNTDSFLFFLGIAVFCVVVFGLSFRALTEYTPVTSYSSLISFVPDRPGHDLCYAIDDTRIRTELGWTPKESFEAGLRKTVPWYIDNPERVRRVRTGEYREWIKKNYDMQGRGKF